MADHAEEVEKALHAVAPLLKAVKATNYRPITADQVAALRLLEILSARTRASDRVAIAHKDVVGDTTLAKATVARVLPLQAAEFLPLLEAVAGGKIAAWTAEGVRTFLARRQWLPVLAGDEPDGNLVALLDATEKKWRTKLRAKTRYDLTAG